MFADCYVCSAGRRDGLGAHFGALPSHPDMTGAVVIADATVPHHDGGIAIETAWAALDCPSYTPPLWTAERPSLLAQMTAEVLEPMPLGEPVVVVGWTLSRDGRKHGSATALLSADGRTLARSRALWIELRA